MYKILSMAVAGVALIGAHPPQPCFKGHSVSITLDPPKAYIAPPMTTYQRERALALTIFGECRGCDSNGKLAVGYTIINRVRHGQAFYDDYHIEDVVWRRKQYSCWNRGDPNRKVLAHIGRLEKNSPDAISWTISKGIAHMLIHDRAPKDPTRGALYYHTKSISPWWLKDTRLKKTATIGDHVFYRIKKSH